MLYAESSAGMAITEQKGAEQLRHVHISALRIQDIQDGEGTIFQKIDGVSNPADLIRVDRRWASTCKGEERPTVDD